MKNLLNKQNRPWSLTLQYKVNTELNSMTYISRHDQAAIEKQLQCDRALPPHPGPLPRGEGIAFDITRSSERSSRKSRRRLSQATETILPLPEGEGRGEGDGHSLITAPPPFTTNFTDTQ